MKNIFLLPTEESSRIGRFVYTQKLLLRSEKDSPRGENVNIYITSEEEVNVNDHVIVSCSEAEIEEVRIVTGYYNEQFLFDDKSQIHMDYCKKIILTTDFRLAPDVQKIDDEFLEWFVKNPGCEFVHAYNDRVVGYEYDNYTIIIPTEETKPHYFCETPEEKCTMNYCDENGCQNRKRNLGETENYPNGECGAFAKYSEGVEQRGLTKREYFAGLAMQGLLTRVPKRDNDEVDLGILELKRIVEESIIISEALLEELSKSK